MEKNKKLHSFEKLAHAARPLRPPFSTWAIPEIQGHCQSVFFGFKPLFSIAELKQNHKIYQLVIT